MFNICLEFLKLTYFAYLTIYHFFLNYHFVIKNNLNNLIFYRLKFFFKLNI